MGYLATEMPQREGQQTLLKRRPCVNNYTFMEGYLNLKGVPNMGTLGLKYRLKRYILEPLGRALGPQSRAEALLLVSE